MPSDDALRSAWELCSRELGGSQQHRPYLVGITFEDVVGIAEEAEQLGREGGIRDAIKVQDAHTAGELAGKELLAPYARHLWSCVVLKPGESASACTCGLTRALKKQPKVT